MKVRTKYAYGHYPCSLLMVRLLISFCMPSWEGGWPIARQHNPDVDGRPGKSTFLEPPPVGPTEYLISYSVEVCGTLLPGITRSTPCAQ